MSDQPRHPQALGLPAGSVRAALALLVVGSLWVWLYRRPERPLPDHLQNLMFIILGHYFAARAPARADDAGPAPLHLPRGSVRVLLVLGFVGVGVALWLQGRALERAPDGALAVRAGAVTLVLVGGFLLGVLVRTIGARLPGVGAGGRVVRIFADARAVVALAAGAVLAVQAIGLVEVRMEDLSQTWSRTLSTARLHEVVSALVGFYFGSRT